MKRLLSCVLSALVLSGCVGGVRKELEALPLHMITDPVVAWEAAEFHNEEGQWPESIYDLSLAGDLGEVQSKIGRVMFFTQDDGSVVIDFDNHSPRHRHIYIDEPDFGNTVYRGSFHSLGGTMYVFEGDLMIDLDE